MAYENIRLVYPNYCIGPQAGTYCSVNMANPAYVMEVRNNSGVLIRNYDFYPPGNMVNSNGYVVIDIKYIGPQNISGFYTGLVFYTLERKGTPSNTYRDYGVYITEDDDENSIAARTGCKIRRWVLDQDNFRLNMDYFYMLSSYNAYSFAIRSISTYLTSAASANSGSIELASITDINIGDLLMIGPSTDVDNLNATDNCYVHSFGVGNTINIRTNAGSYIPTQYDYQEGDAVVIFKNMFIIDDTGTSSDDSTLYELDPLNSGAVISSNDSGVYKGASAMSWCKYLGLLAVVKKNIMLYIDVNDYEVGKSQILHNTESDQLSVYSIYEVEFEDTDIYLLQKQCTMRNDAGSFNNYTWSSYNYVNNSLIPYTNSVTLYSYPKGILLEGITTGFYAVVRDQFGVTLLGKNIQFYKSGDISGYFTPTGGSGVTDANGTFDLTYTAGVDYTGLVFISVRADGSSNVNGSQYEWSNGFVLSVHHQRQGTMRIKQVYDDKSNKGELQQWSNTINSDGRVFCLSKFQFPGGNWSVESTKPEGPDFQHTNNYDREKVTILRQVVFPVFNIKSENSTADSVVVRTSISQHGLKEGNTAVNTRPALDTERQVSQVLVSRHLNGGNTDYAEINQFVFVIEAVPALWSKKNTIDTDIWIRLRPYAASLDVNRVSMSIREISYVGDTDWIDISDDLVITTFDAGSGLFGLDINYYYPGDFHHGGTVYVAIVVYDTSSNPNMIVLDYWFRIVPDYKAPYIVNEIPSRESESVAVDSVLEFDVLDDGAGVDINTLEVYVNRRLTDFSSVQIDKGYHITCVPEREFAYSSSVDITIKVKDLSGSKNMLYDYWRFYCGESTAPWYNNYNYAPGMCRKGIDRNLTEISMQVYAVGNGLDEDSIILYIGQKKYKPLLTPIVYRVT